MGHFLQWFYRSQSTIQISDTHKYFCFVSITSGLTQSQWRIYRMRHLWLVKVYFYMADSTDKINSWLLRLDYTKVPCQVELSWIQVSVEKIQYFTFKSNSGLFAKSKEVTIYYWSKLCSRSRVKLASWLLITLQSDQQGKLSVSNHLQHTCQWEKGWMSACLLCLLKYQFEKWGPTVLTPIVQQTRAINSHH